MARALDFDPTIAPAIDMRDLLGPAPDEIGRENDDERGQAMTAAEIAAEAPTPLRPARRRQHRTDETHAPSSSSPDDASQDMPLVLMVLHQDDDTRKSCWNRAAAAYTGSDVVHCEIYFPHNASTCTVDSSRPVSFLKHKKYWKSVRTWEAWRVFVSPVAYGAAYAWCSSRLGGTFDKRARCAFPIYTCIQVRTNDRWLCSRLAAGALRTAGVAPYDIDLNQATPASLLAMIKALRDTDFDARKVPLRELKAMITA